MSDRDREIAAENHARRMEKHNKIRQRRLEQFRKAFDLRHLDCLESLLHDRYTCAFTQNQFRNFDVLDELIGKSWEGIER